MKIATIVGCSVYSCEKPVRVLSRMLCNRHYLKWRKYGTPEQGKTYYDTPEEKFLAETVRQGECLIWTAGMIPGGYGTLWVGGADMLAHRYSYERSVGPIPEGMLIDHKCFNPSCVEPKHLRIATYQQNNENRRPETNTESGVRGVTWCSVMNKWRTRVGQKLIGYFDTVEESAEAVRVARNNIHTFNDVDRLAT